MKRNKLTEEYPQIANEWNFKRNLGLNITDMTIGSAQKVWWKCSKGHEWPAKIYQRCNGLTGCPYCAGRKAIVGETDLATVNPELCKEWHLNKNGELSPQDFTANSGKKVWWQCKNGHEWEATIEHRNNDHGCPYCVGQKVMIGYNDLETVNPKVAMEWHPDKNGELTPQNVTVGSGNKVWWICKKGHEWEATVINRCKGNGCPYCAGKKTIIGETDLATVNPELSKEWHPSKNGELAPQDVTACSERKVWWQCKSGHEWDATIVHRTQGTGCPYCTGKKAIVGETDLATLNPELGKEWHPSKNGVLTPQNVTFGSGNKVWWICKKGHEWEATVRSRFNGNGCPYCNGKKVKKGETDLATIDPELAKEWHPNKNNDLKPEDVTIGSGRRVWWQCGKGHEWIAAVVHRNKNNTRTGCPYCAGMKAIVGETDLATVNPELSKEWHPNKNGKLKPQDVTAGSSKKVWWKCKEGHEWKSTVDQRVNGSNCPFCAGLRVISGVTDLRTKNPELAKEWHKTKNGKLSPFDVTVSSSRKVWWQCSKGHEWRAVVARRNNGTGCPYCAHKKKI